MGDEESVVQEGELQETVSEEGETEGQEGEFQAEDGVEEEQESAPPKRASDVDSKLKGYEQQLEYFRGMLRQQEALIDVLRKQTEAAIPREPDPLESLDPEEPLTARHIALIEKKLKMDYDGKMQTMESKSRKALALLSEKAARQIYDDYDEVLGFTADLAKQNPSIVQRIALSDDPAEEAYRQGMLHPQYMAKIRTGQKREVLKKVASNLRKPRPVSAMAGGKTSGALKVKDVLEMTPEEFREYRRNKVGI